MFECLSLGCDTIRRCGLVGIGVTLLEKVCQCRAGLWGLIYAQAMPSVVHSLSLMPSDLDVELSAYPGMSTCMQPCFPTMMAMDWTSETVSQPQLSVFLYKSCYGHSVFSTAIDTLTKTEVGVRDWGISVTGLTMFLFGEMWALDLKSSWML